MRRHVVILLDWNNQVQDPTGAWLVDDVLQVQGADPVFHAVVG